ncbi:alpha/beta hydrolase [Foetidibacter luteolus]|uniref:alpha/beta hydrolase n=1 Tax=Foetidibacter luteolus TaxID=2608880 RepID=UPI00129AB33C|nr:alpha/beta fold hydrolase [Foetidibacter luteolus]
MKKAVKIILKTLLIIYLAAGIALYFLQDKIMFHPKVLPSDYVFKFTDSFKEASIRYDSATTFHFVKFFPKDTAKGIVIYFHGNRGSIERYRRFVNNFTKHGYEVWMMDYVGFGKSTGIPGEQMMYEEAMQIYKMARVHFTPQRIVIYGKSLGTGVATQLASRRDCRRLILETPYYSMVSVAQHYAWMYPVSLMVKCKLPTNEYLPKVTAPVTIFHGTEDDVIPYSNAVKLKTLLKPGDEFITLPGGDHRNLNSFPVMQQKLDSLLSD